MSAPIECTTCHHKLAYDSCYSGLYRAMCYLISWNHGIARKCLSLYYTVLSSHPVSRRRQNRSLLLLSISLARSSRSTNLRRDGMEGHENLRQKPCNPVPLVGSSFG